MNGMGLIPIDFQDQYQWCYVTQGLSLGHSNGRRVHHGEEWKSSSHTSAFSYSSQDHGGDSNCHGRTWEEGYPLHANFSHPGSRRGKCIGLKHDLLWCLPFFCSSVFGRYMCCTLTSALAPPLPAGTKHPKWWCSCSSHSNILSEEGQEEHKSKQREESYSVTYSVPSFSDAFLPGSGEINWAGILDESSTEPN